MRARTEERTRPEQLVAGTLSRVKVDVRLCTAVNGDCPQTPIEVNKTDQRYLSARKRNGNVIVG